jgi:lantibiotic modifying enzyme
MKGRPESDSSLVLSTVPTQSWHPKRLANAEKALSIALEVAGRLRHSRTQDTNASLACGDAGLAVLFGYIDRVFPEAGWDKVAHEAVSRTTAYITTSPEPSIGLFGGLAGLGFATAYLSRSDTRYRRARLAIEDLLLPRASDLAESFAKKYGMRVEDYDLVTGLSGVAAYLLCRIHDDRARQALQTVVGALVEIVGRDAPLPAWFTPADMISAKSMIGKYPEGNLNCGLAHGMPGILSVLALASLEGVDAPGLHSAIRRLADWLMARRAINRWGASWWPGAVGVRAQDPVAPAPMAWCYGNPGVARALWLAGTAVHDVELCEAATEGLRSVFRRPASRPGVTSPTFCHGAAGLLQITMRFANDTELPDLCDAASGILDQLLNLFSEDARFGYRDYDDETGSVDRVGLLDGAAGVALVLFTAASNQAPDWDRMFLLS